MTLVFVAGGTLILGLALVAWALLWDCARGRRRCPKCQYDMAGIAGLRCPECGREQRNEKQFHRTHRRWRWAACGLVIAAVSVVCGIVTARHVQWAPHLPTWVLVRIVDPQTLSYSWQADTLATELHQRMAKRGLSTSESQVLIDRVMALDPRQTDNLVRTRTRWPAGVPVSVSSVSELPVLRGTVVSTGTTVRVRLISTADGDPGPWIEMPSFSPAKEVGVPVAGTGSMKVEVQLHAGPVQVWHGFRTLQTSISGTPEELLAPVSGLKVDADLAEFLVPCFEVHEGSIGVWVRNSGRQRVFSHYVALGLRLRLFYNGSLVATGSMSCPPPFDEFGGSYSQEPAYEFAWLNRVAKAPDGAPDQGWDLEITGDRDLALLDYDQCGWSSTKLSQVTWVSPSGVPAHGIPWREPTEYWSGKIRVRAWPGRMPEHHILGTWLDPPFR